MNHSIALHNPFKNMARYKQVARVGPCRLQLATVYKIVYFGVKTIVPSPSKPAAVFKMNEGDDKITLPDVINSKILEYTHWSNIFMLCSLSDSQKREINMNKPLIFDLTMQRLDKIIKTTASTGTTTGRTNNEHQFILKNRVSFMAQDRTLKTGYIVHFLEQYVSIVHCDYVFDEGTVVMKMRSAKVNHIRPFVGEVEEMVNNYSLIDSRVGI
jgi:hypothetical protein